MPKPPFRPDGPHSAATASTLDVAAWLGSRRIRRMVGALLTLALIAAVFGMAQIRKEPGRQALIAPDHPVRQIEQQLRDDFGHRDTLVVAIAGTGPGSVLTQDAVGLLDRIADSLRGIDGISADSIKSLRSLGHPVFRDGALSIEPLLPRDTTDVAATLNASLAAMPEADGLLIARDRSALLVLAAVADGQDSGEVYQRAAAVINSLPVPPGLAIVIGGKAAVSGFVKAYIDQDAMVLTPVGIVIALLLLASFMRHWTGIVPGAFVVLGTLILTLGLMGWSGRPFYSITSTLPAILVCVAIADCIHLAARAGRLRAQMDADAAVAQALREMFRPMLVTSLTTMAGFAGLGLTASSVALGDFGLFAAIGTAIAFLLTVTGVPLLLRALPGAVRMREHRVLSGALSRYIATRPVLAVSIGMLLLAAAIGGLFRLDANDAEVRNFAPDSAIRRADILLNTRFAGTYGVDLLIESEAGQLLEPALMQRVQAFQDRLEALDLLRAPYSYVDLVQVMRRAAQADGAKAELVTVNDAEQWLYLYELSGERTRVDELLRSDRQVGLIRGFRPSDDFRSTKAAIAAIEAEVQRSFAGTPLRVTIGGPVRVTLAVFEPVVANALAGAALSAALVAVVAAVALGGVVSGAICMLPVLAAVAGVYGVLGWAGLQFDLPSSMMGAVAIGLGVDFCLYTQIAALEARASGLRGGALAARVYEDIATPLTANAVILIAGFTVTVLSAIPPVRNFGILMAAAIIGSFVAALLFVPSLHAILSRRRLPRCTEPSVQGACEP